MKEKQWGWWEVAKIALTIVVLLAVGWQFYRDLGKLREWPAMWPEWLAYAGLLYLVGMGFSAIYWGRLMAHLGASPTALPSARAYYISQLGKYVPGKAMALILRVGLVASPAVPMSTAALAAFHEVLATMASGAIVGCFCSLALPVGKGMNWEALWQVDAGHDPERWEMFGLAAALALATTGPILPPIFNRLAAAVTAPFRTGELPQVGWASLGEGLLVTAPCWLFLGLSLGCGLAAVGAEVPGLAVLVSSMAVAYVAGFVVPISPGGLGVREFLLALLLASSDEGREKVLLAILLLRLSWTLAEVVAAGILYPLAGRTESQGGPT
jgi:uncharacterized membrane protein YbhN (UPF0104 family)